MRQHSVPRPVQVHNVDHANAVAFLLAAALLGLACPGAALGAVGARAAWQVTSPPILMRWLVAGLGAATAATMQGQLVVGWPWRLLVHLLAPRLTQGLPALLVVRSLPVEMLLGPLLLLLAETGTTWWDQTIHGQEWARYREMAERKRALERGWQGPTGKAATRAPEAHPHGTIRLGTLATTGRPFDLGVDEIAHHVFLPGASGSGKTTTLVCLADGALANGYGVVIIDCKGTGLGADAKALARRHGMPYTVVDPHDRKSVGYDVCSGDAAAVANKIVGAFSFSGEAEIYKHVAMEVIPVIVRAMQASGTPVTLDGIYDALGRGGLSQLGRRPGADAFRDRLNALEDSGGVGAAGYVGLQRRLGALMEGTFGEVFRRTPALDWTKELSKPRVTYVSLSATGASEDVELFGRVITQDLKQVCDQRLRAIQKGRAVVPVLVIYDEFAALREATQVVDLLLQARQARMPLVVATQFLPEEVPIRQPVLSAGVLIVHRLEAQDAELVAAQFGTHRTTNLTAQVDYETGESQKGSVRFVEEYNMHPNDLKNLPVGMAAVLSRRSNRRDLVRVQKTA
jgi:energy-coupling factor transporter ATP-binding protein EcfA2